MHINNTIGDCSIRVFQFLDNATETGVPTKVGPRAKLPSFIPPHPSPNPFPFPFLSPHRPVSSPGRILG